MRYILGVLGVIMVAVLAIVMITRGPNDKKPAANTPKKVVISQQNNDGTSAVFTTQGKVVGEEQYRSIRITISQDERRLEVLSGYDDTVTTSQVYPNTSAAYGVFLASLEKAGFGLSRKSTVTSPVGVCPMGRRFLYELKDYDQKLIDLWGTSCGNKIGTAVARVSNIRGLFEAQIPEYRKQVAGVKL